MVLLATGDGSKRVMAEARSDEAHPPQRLSETGLYAAGRPGVVDEANQAFSPQYPLWSDNATKRRWVFIPPGTTIDTTDPKEWDFPVGTRFWKEFSFGGRKVETRMLWRASTTRWVFASYAWNEQGTEAILAPEEGLTGVAEVAAGKEHGIPSVADCRACHETRRVEPLGFNALQLSTDRDPHAIHGEALAPGMVTLRTLHEEGRLQPARPELLATPPRIRTENARTRAVLGYLAANCGVCHNRDADVPMLGSSLKHGDVAEDGEAAVRAMVGHRTGWQIPGTPDGTSVVAGPASPESSALLVRMRSRRPSSQMPPLGTVVADREAIDAISQWIATDLAAPPPER
jgi:hypothetical protein